MEHACKDQYTFSTVEPWLDQSKPKSWSVLISLISNMLGSQSWIRCTQARWRVDDFTWKKIKFDIFDCQSWKSYSGTRLHPDRSPCRSTFLDIRYDMIYAYLWISSDSCISSLRLMETQFDRYASWRRRRTALLNHALHRSHNLQRRSYHVQVRSFSNFHSEQTSLFGSRSCDPLNATFEGLRHVNHLHLASSYREPLVSRPWLASSCRWNGTKDIFKLGSYIIGYAILLNYLVPPSYQMLTNNLPDSCISNEHHLPMTPLCSFWFSAPKTL